MSDLIPIRKRPRRTWPIAWRALARDSHAGTAIEYGLVASLVIITMILSLQGLANATVGMWNNVSTKMQNAH